MSKAQRTQAITGVLFASPWIIGFLAFTLYPIASSLFYSFTSYNLFEYRFIGLNNYKAIFNNPDFWKSMGNTLYYVVISVPLNILLGVLLGMLLAQKTLGVRLYRTIYYLPNVLSAVAVTFLWKFLFGANGPINNVLSMFGISGPVWLNSEAAIKPALIIMSAWGVGGTVVIFLAAIKGVPESLYEAAKVDGANAFVRFFKITMPSISSTIYFSFLMSIIGGFQMFLPAFLLTGGREPGKAAYFIGQMIYERGPQDHQMGFASALSWILLIIMLVITIIAVKTSDNLVSYMEG